MRFFWCTRFIVAVILATLAWAGVACEEQRPKEGQMKCEDASECPSGWFCRASDSLCYASDAGDETVDNDG